jgi:hypothetical protein
VSAMAVVLMAGVMGGPRGGAGYDDDADSGQNVDVVALLL